MRISEISEHQFVLFDKNGKQVIDILIFMYEQNAYISFICDTVTSFNCLITFKDTMVFECIDGGWKNEI